MGKILDQEIYRVPYLVDFFIENKLENKAKIALYNILAGHFNRTIKNLLTISTPEDEQGILTFLERYAPDIIICLETLFEHQS